MSGLGKIAPGSSDVWQVNYLQLKREFNRLGKQRSATWPAAVIGAQGQGMGVSSSGAAKCSFSVAS